MSSSRRQILACLIPCFLLTAALGLAGDGVHHDDDLTHFLFARWARCFPGYLLHAWGRPGLTVPLAAVAWIGDDATGWHAARLLSAIVTACGALLAAGLAARRGLARPWVVILACYLQPHNTLLACTTLTENFTALYLIAAVFLLLVRGAPVWASLVFSLTLVTRHEAVLWIPVWWIALATCGAPARRSVTAAAAALAAPLLHNLLFFLVFEEWPVRLFFSASGSTEYPPMGALGYLPFALLAVPPVLAGMALLGAAALLKGGHRLVVALPVVYLAGHTAIKAMGLYGSGGYARFMVAVSPLVAILVVAGFDGFVSGWRGRRPLTIEVLVLATVWLVGWLALEAETGAGRIQIRDERFLLLLRGGALFMTVLLVAAAMAARTRVTVGLFRCSFAAMALTVAGQFLAIVRPMRASGQQAAVRDVVRWLERQGLSRQPLFSTNPWFAFELGFAENPRAHKGPALLASMPVGTIFVWDSKYSPNGFHRLPLRNYLPHPCYELLSRFDRPDGTAPSMYVFRKTAPTPVPPEPERYYPPDLSARRRPIRGVYYVRTRT